MCKEGYFGARCQSCSPGFYGKPEVLGKWTLFRWRFTVMLKSFLTDDYCKPCQCSENIDPRDANACDTVTGECLRCLNNTFGEACSLCAPGFYGDAVVLKDCQGEYMTLILVLRHVNRDAEKL